MDAPGWRRRAITTAAAVICVLPVQPAANAGQTPASDNPFDGPVGGELLGTTDEAVVDADAPKLPSSIKAPAWLVADAESGDVLAARSAHEPRPPASTLKLLTALATLPHVDANATYTATDEDASVEGSRVGLAPRQKYTLDDIMHGIFLSSGNDAAHALANLAGGQPKTIDAMNAEADRLGAFDTTAKTPHGLDINGQVSSAYDLALLGQAALKDKQIAKFAQTSNYKFPGLDGESFQIQSTNRLLGSYDGAIGLKNGYTTKARYTVVAAAERDGRRLIAVVMGTKEPAEDQAAPLLDWAFEADTPEPVGHLVTPDEVERAWADGGADRDGDQPDNGAAALSPGGDGGTEWRTFGYMGAGILVAALIAGLLLRRPRHSRQPRRNADRAGGRYASRG